MNKHAKIEEPQKAALVSGKKPAAATTMGVARSRTTTGGRGHQHSNSTPPPLTSTATTKLSRAASSASSFGRSASTSSSSSSSHARSHSTSAVSEMTTVLVGRKRQAFVVNRRLLCAASPFFRDQLQQRMHSSPTSGVSPSPSSSGGGGDGFYTYRPITLWLPGESTTMFGLFVEWLHAPSSFRSFLDDTAALAHGDGGEATQLLHWALVRLHLFAAHLGLLALQDLAMDAVQDLYLRCDWDVAPSVIAYLYTRCEARHAARLRRWAVAMVAFSLTVAWHLNHEQQGGGGGAATSSTPPAPPPPPPAAATVPRRLHQRTASASASSASAVCDPARLHSMLDALPEFQADYATHVRSMRGAGLDMRFKNPQLRIPANALRNDKRAFGFRECSFHSHRAAVGQGPCPHASSGLRAAETGSMLDLAPPPDEGDEDGEDGGGDDDNDDDTRQWEREWADEYRALVAAAEYTHVPTTSSRPSPPLRTMSGGGGTRPLVSRFGHDRARSLSRG